MFLVMWQVMGLKVWLSLALAFGFYKIVEGGGNLETVGDSLARAATNATVWVNNRTGQVCPCRARLAVYLF